MPLTWHFPFIFEALMDFNSIPRRKNVLVTGVQAVGQIGQAAAGGQSFVYVTGVQAVGYVGNVTVWGVVNDNQAANWQNVDDSQSGTWVVVDDSQSSTWTRIAA